MPVKLTQSGNSQVIRSRLQRLQRSRILVGVPPPEAPRGNSPINNATLLAILTNGSHLNNLPPRPVLEPAITDSENKATITAPMKAAAQAALDDNGGQVDANLERAALAAQNAAKGWFTNPKNGWPPNAPMTIKRKGSAQPMIDTGALRNAIVGIVDKTGTMKTQN